MTRRAVLLFQMAWPEQIQTIKHYVDGNSFNIEAWLLNEDGTPHMLLFDGGPFKSDEQLDGTIKRLLEYKD
jgi:hypothetical protein